MRVGAFLVCVLALCGLERQAICDALAWGRTAVMTRFAERLWQGQLHEYVAAQSTAGLEPGGILFVGSSSVRRWDLQNWFPEFRQLVNRGLDGSQIRDLVRHAPRIVHPQAPRVVVFYSGENDLAFGHTPQEVFEDFRRFWSELSTQLPGTRLICLSVKLSPSRLSLRPVVAEFNEMLRTFCRDSDRLSFVDVNSTLLDATGSPAVELFQDDRLHLNPAGYARWTDVLRPLLRQASL